jgi:hypothetical protein
MLVTPDPNLVDYQYITPTDQPELVCNIALHVLFVVVDKKVFENFDGRQKYFDRVFCQSSKLRNWNRPFS